SAGKFRGCGRPGQRVQRRSGVAAALWFLMLGGAEVRQVPYACVVCIFIRMLPRSTPADCVYFRPMSAQVPENSSRASEGDSVPAGTPLQQARRIVVKVGSALLVDAETGRINRAWLETLIEDLLRLRKRNQQVILVSSGAIALGR